MILARHALLAAVAFAIVPAGCAGDDDRTDPDVEAPAVLASLADDVIIPTYDDLVAALEALVGAVDGLCVTPDQAALEAARDDWRAVTVAYRRTLALGVGPARDRRLSAEIGFLARANSIDELLGGTDPVDGTALHEAGAGVKGVSALEIALFAGGSESLTTVVGARRCEYATSITGLARDASAEVLDDWTGGYRDTFVEGIDGDPQSSIDAIVNEATFRVTELDDQGLRALVEAGGPDDLSANRADGPAAFHLQELEGTLNGVRLVLGDGLSGPRIIDLVATVSADTAARLDDAVQAATAALLPLPDSVTQAFSDPGEIAAAQEAVMGLKVLLSTEVASELGVTISFSDADGDS